ncbi:AMP-binding protein [Heliomicrobium gestii]|uniref:AMP-binding protein n=1 Tax=Heliomicrobium gestii TaxID=2699 RepID=UPI002E27E37E|nr:AMP-binding protein [Heliomicrobium gestii]MBM7866791.1 acyl-[acyl-carrier-protein]-phospholipid O-acyltransferase/long-chain-fatty-acid--[acyl-carrier-protein] ligase [Heliomicrobium gestii]
MRRLKLLILILRFLFLRLFRLRLVHFDRLQSEGPLIIMPNHVSFLDPLILGLFLPEDIVFVVNSAMAAKIPFALRFRKHITIDPLNPYSVRDIVAAVKGGMSVVLFPEGRITTINGIMKIYDGIAFVAQKTGVPVYPIGIDGPQNSRFSRLEGKMPRRWFPPITIYVDEPFTLRSTRGQQQKEQKSAGSERILKALERALFHSRRHEGINLFNELIDAARLYGMNREILEDISQKLTYRKLLLGVYALSAPLAQKLSGEERVGVMLPNAVAHVVTLFALFRVNITPAILNFTSGPQGVLDSCETAELKTVVTSRQFIEKAGLQAHVEKAAEKARILYLEDLRDEVTGLGKLQALCQLMAKVRTRPGRERLILFTSGSESKPKGVILRHDNIQANVMQACTVIALTAKDKLLNALPMFHSFGLQGAFIPLLCGLEVFLYPTPLHYKIIPEIAYDRNATILFGTGTFLQGYGKHAHPFDFYSIRYVITGGERLKEETRRLWLDKFGLRPMEGYGCTEASPFLAINSPLCYKAGSVGRIFPGVEHRIEPVEGIERGGNLFVKGPNVMEGYLIHGKGFVPVDEWYDCGDLVEEDGQGCITILSRLKRFAKLGGEMVSLNLIEELAVRCFHSPEVAAVNIAGGKKGEQVVLFTTVKTASRQALRDYIVASGQSPLLVPARICPLDCLPLLGSGKTDYVTLKTVYAEALAAEPADDGDDDEAHSREDGQIA